MATKIESTIVSYRVLTALVEETQKDTIEKQPDVMNESIQRPDMLMGATYKIKTPASEHALYITFSDIILNEGTEHEERRPYEIFINSKNMEHFQWVVALTRVISATFRKGGDALFLIEEMKAVFDPKGGYFKKGTYMPSLVAEIGYVLEKHMIFIGMIKKEVDENMQKYIQAKRDEYMQKEENRSSNDEEFPSTATVCAKCNNKSVVRMDGCLTCLNCGDSKCG